MKVRERRRLAPQTGAGFRLRRGELLRIIDPQGEQVSDLFCVSRDEHAELLSSGRSIDYAGSIRLSTGAILYSNRSRPMLSIVEDTVGVHDFLLTPCSSDTFRILYGIDGGHPSCQQNLVDAFASVGATVADLPATFNAFMNVIIRSDGTLQIDPPASRGGDSLTLRAEMDLLVGVTACSAELSNNRSFKPIDVEIGTEGSNPP